MDCVACDSATDDLVILSPCGHFICSRCLTSSLNIVGEKQFACMRCRVPVKDFSFVSASDLGLYWSTLSAKQSKSSNISTTKHMTQSDTSKPSPSDELLSVIRLDDVPWVIYGHFCPLYSERSTDHVLEGSYSGNAQRMG